MKFLTINRARQRSVLQYFLSAVLLLGCSVAARSATLVVTNTNDAGSGSFREAIALANQNIDEDSIVFDRSTFAPTRTIVLTSGEIIVTTPVRILGPGVERLSISGNNLSRVLFLRNTASVHLSNLTITNGKAPVVTQNGFSNYAGGIYIDGGALFLSQVTIANCVGEQAGGIYNRLGTLHIVNSTITNNQATGGRNDGSYGGGINNDGTLVMVNSRVVGNIARGGNAPVGGGGAGLGTGAGLYVFHGIVTIIGSLFENNSSLGGSSSGGFGGQASGGAITMTGQNTLIIDTLVTGNSATAGSGDIPTRAGSASGGGILNLDVAHLINVTVSNNTATSTNGGGVSGGAGIWNSCSGCMTLTNSTVAFNTATGVQGGGAYGYGAIRLRNTVVANNAAPFGPDVSNNVVTLGNNLIGNGSNTFGIVHGVNGDQVGTAAAPIDPLLGPLSGNGGLTRTHMPQAGSPAINAGNNCVVLLLGSGGCLTTPLVNDQRGYSRQFGGIVDLGAAEVEAAPLNLPVPGIPDLELESDSGISNTDNLTSELAPRFAISNAPVGALVELLRNGVVVGSTYSSGGSVIIADSPRSDGLSFYSSRLAFNGTVGPESSSLPVTIDTVRPGINVAQSPQQVDPTAIGTAAFTVMSSEPVFGFTPGDVSLAGSTANTSSAEIAVTGSGTFFGITVTNIVSDGQFVRASVPAGSVVDSAGNSNTASGSTDNTVTVDNVAPSVTVNQAASQPDPTGTQPIRYTVNFSEGITGFSASDISFTGSTANVSTAVVNVSGSGTSYDLAISNVLSAGTVRVSIPAGVAADSLGNLNIQSTSTDSTVTVVLGSSPFDFDGDGKTDVGIFRQSVGEWWINQSSNGVTTAGQFGSSSDVITPADFTGDGKTDTAFFQPSSGFWFVLRSEDFSYFAFPFGANGDVPVPADYDGDGKADATVFRPSSSTWFIQRSSDGGATIGQFGSAGDVPVPADYDGDGKADIAIYRPSLGQWWVQRSTAGILVLTFGDSNDKPVQGDFTGDGKADIAFWRPSTGEWFISRSEDLSYYSLPFGSNGDIPAPGDYDGDGKFDPTVFRPSQATWYSQRSTAGILIQQFGANGDRPIPNAFVP